MNRRAAAIINSLGIKLDLRQPVKNLSTAQRRVAAVGKALLQNVSLLIMDEPTARLSSWEIEALFSIIR